MVKPDYVILSGRAVGLDDHSNWNILFYSAIFISKNDVKVMAQRKCLACARCWPSRTKDCHKPQMVSLGKVEDTLTLHPVYLTNSNKNQNENQNKSFIQILESRSLHFTQKDNPRNCLLCLKSCSPFYKGR